MGNRFTASRPDAQREESREAASGASSPMALGPVLESGFEPGSGVYVRDSGLDRVRGLGQEFWSGFGSASVLWTGSRVWVGIRSLRSGFGPGCGVRTGSGVSARGPRSRLGL